MAITWRRALWEDVETGLAIQPRHWGDAKVGREAAVKAWKVLFRSPFFLSVALESSPPIREHRIVGFGASILISGQFADAEIANPEPDINARVIASIHSAHPVLATWKEVARANAAEGVDALILIGSWRDQIFDASEREELQAVTIASFVETHAGYRFRRIIQESADKPRRDFLQRSAVIKTLAEFPETGRVIHLMTRESAKFESSSLANVLFGVRDPVLRLRDSDQRLLLAALTGATDQELASDLGITLSAVKARWRSTVQRIEETMPNLVGDTDARDGRGVQKRHRILAYVRSHPVELRPYDWKPIPRFLTAGPRN